MSTSPTHTRCRKRIERHPPPPVSSAIDPPAHLSGSAPWGARRAAPRTHCRLGLGKLYRRVGRPDEARAELATAISMLREMGMAFWLPEAERELAEASR